MGGYVIHRPDPAAMEEILRENRENAAGAVVRLAWQAGLLREEIRGLTWAQVDLLNQTLALPDRTVPLTMAFSSVTPRARIFRAMTIPKARAAMVSMVWYPSRKPAEMALMGVFQRSAGTP